MDEKIFRGQDWYVFIDDQFTFGYTEGILTIPIEDLKINVYSDLYIGSVIEIILPSIKIIIQMSKDHAHKMYIYTFSPIIKIYIPPKKFFQLYKILNLNYE